MVPASVQRGLRNLVRRFGFDVVRYRPVPPDVDRRTAETVRMVKSYTMTSAQRVVALCDAVRYISRSGIEGSIVECGVWKGGSMMAVARTLLEEQDAARPLFLFDTFEGMTAPSKDDVSLDGRTAADQLRDSSKQDAESVWCVAPIQGVREAMRKTGYDESKLFFVQGRVEDTIPSQAPDRIALLRLDTDWYESTRHELEHLFPRLAPGGVLIIDDYGHWSGARKAVDEYFKRNSTPILLQRIDYSGRSAIKWR